MGKKVHPNSYRLGINRPWRSVWFASLNGINHKRYILSLEEDFAIRALVREKLAHANIDSIIIDRSADNIVLKLTTSRPGLVIGKGGKGLEVIRKDLESIVARIRRQHDTERKMRKVGIKIDIEEIRKPDIHANLVAQNIREQLERRMPYKRIMKQTLEKVSSESAVKGVKIRISGRLNGSDIARSEWLSKGKIPLQTLRANIDFARETAHTTFGTIGIKVWIYTGNVFKQDQPLAKTTRI